MDRLCYEEGMAAMLKSHEVTHFTALELASVGRVNEGVQLKAPPANLWPNIIPTVRIAEEARDHFGEPLHVNSGYRDEMYNRSVGSTSRRHVDFYALDVSFRVTPPDQLFDWLDAHPRAGEMGLGLYLDFVHMDLMGRMSRWGIDLK